MPRDRGGRRWREGDFFDFYVGFGRIPLKNRGADGTIEVGKISKLRIGARKEAAF